MIEESSPFQPNSFVSNSNYFLDNLFTPILIFSRKAGNGTKNIIETFPLSHLHQLRDAKVLIYVDGGETPPLLRQLCSISFPDCALRGGAGENPQRG